MISAAYAGQYKAAYAHAVEKGQTPGLDPDVIGGILASGQVGVAIELLQAAKKSNPELASQIDEYIKQLVAQKR